MVPRARGLRRVFLCCLRHLDIYDGMLNPPESAHCVDMGVHEPFVAWTLLVPLASIVLVGRRRQAATAMFHLIALIAVPMVAVGLVVPEGRGPDL